MIASILDDEYEKRRDFYPLSVMYLCVKWLEVITHKARYIIYRGVIVPSNRVNWRRLMQLIALNMEQVHIV